MPLPKWARVIVSLISLAVGLGIALLCKSFMWRTAFFGGWLFIIKALIVTVAALLAYWYVDKRLFAIWAAVWEDEPEGTKSPKAKK